MVTDLTHSYISTFDILSESEYLRGDRSGGLPLWICKVVNNECINMLRLHILHSNCNGILTDMLTTMNQLLILELIINYHAT